MRRGLAPDMAFALARRHAVALWHGIIARDLLPRLVHPAIMAAWRGTPAPAFVLDETSLLHGLFRAFHAMPLRGYDVSGLHPLAALMKRGYGRSHAEDAAWRVDWPRFFGRVPGGPVTGLSASIEPGLGIAVTTLATLDLQSARRHWPDRLDSPAIARARRALTRDQADAVRPERLARDFAARWPDAPVATVPQAIADAPPSLALMIEAQLHGQHGGFGPLGSALLLHSVHAAMARVVPRQAVRAVPGLPAPTTMIDLIMALNQLEGKELS